MAEPGSADLPDVLDALEAPVMLEVCDPALVLRAEPELLAPRLRPRLLLAAPPLRHSSAGIVREAAAAAGSPSPCSSSPASTRAPTPSAGGTHWCLCETLPLLWRRPPRCPHRSHRCKWCASSALAEIAMRCCIPDL